MGRMFSAVMDGISISGADDLLRLSAAATDALLIHSVTVTQDAGEISEQLPIQLQRSSTDGTGTSTTPEKLGGVSDAAFNGTCVTALTADTTITGAPLHREGFNVLNGWYYRPTPKEMIVVPPSGRFVVRLDAIPAAALTMTVTVVFEEIG